MATTATSRSGSIRRRRIDPTRRRDRRYTVEADQDEPGEDVVHLLPTPGRRRRTATSTAATPRATQNSSSRNAYRCSAKTTWIENGRRLPKNDQRQQQRERHGHQRSTSDLALRTTARSNSGANATERRVRRREPLPRRAPAPARSSPGGAGASRATTRRRACGSATGPRRRRRWRAGTAGTGR